MSNNINIKNELPELLEALCHHPDCPQWLRFGIYELTMEKPHGNVYTADYWRSEFQAIRADEVEKKANPMVLELISKTRTIWNKQNESETN